MYCLSASFLQGEGISSGPRNAIEMMKEWRKDLTNGPVTHDVGVNGSPSPAPATPTPVQPVLSNSGAAAYSGGRSSHSSSNRLSPSTAYDSTAKIRKGQVVSWICLALMFSLSFIVFPEMHFRDIWPVPLPGETLWCYYKIFMNYTHFKEIFLQLSSPSMWLPYW